MKQAIKVPSVGESVTQATIGEWQKKNGDYVRQNDVLVVMETDKASMDLVAEHSGQLNILKQEGEDVAIGEVIAELDCSASPPTNEATKIDNIKQNQMPTDTAVNTQSPASPNTFEKLSSVPPSLPDSAMTSIKRFPSDKQLMTELLNIDKITSPNPAASASKAEAASGSINTIREKQLLLSPAVRKLIMEHNLDPALIAGMGKDGRITKKDVLSFLEIGSALKASSAIQETNNMEEQQNDLPQMNLPQNINPSVGQSLKQTRKRMTTIRKRIAERLVQSQQSTATLTTFNEIDMSQVIQLRSQYKEAFQKKHNIKLGFMGFFIKATVQALQIFPRVNAFIEGNEAVYNHSCHIGVAVSTDRGLVVPVIQNADRKGMAELEQFVLFYAEKARDGKIIPDDLMGGTFTISNGGVFGSLMSTPILNPPQSGILGMHKIEQRPVVIDGKIEVRPMMYVALSYDHRMVDGRESVGFLLKIKECVENPIRLMIEV